MVRINDYDDDDDAGPTYTRLMKSHKLFLYVINRDKFLSMLIAVVLTEKGCEGFMVVGKGWINS